MKHLQKFNESKKFTLKDNIDVDYVEECFISIIEEYNSEIDDSLDESWDLHVYPTDFHRITEEYDSGEITSIKKHLSEVSNILEVIENCIDKLRIKYENFTPAIAITYDYSSGNMGFYNPISVISLMLTEKCLLANNIS